MTLPVFYWPIDPATTCWLAGVAAALGAGLAVLHGLGKAKDSSEQMLETYASMLERSRQGKAEHDTERAEPAHDGDADQPAA